MEVVLNQVNQAEVILTVNLSSKDYQDKVASEVRKYAQKIIIPGFRAGNKAIIRQRYGEEIARDVVKDFLDKALKDYTSSHDVDFLSSSFISFPEDMQDKIFKLMPVTVYIPLEIIPNFDLNVDKTIEIEEYQLSEVSKRDLEDQINRIKYKYGNSVKGKEIKENTFLYFKWIANKDSNDFDTVIHFTPDLSEDFNSWIGLKVGNEVSISFEMLTKVAVYLPKKIKEMARNEKEMQLKLYRITEVQTPELDDAFRKTVLKDEGLDPEQDFDAYVHDEANKRFTRELEELNDDSIEETLLERVNIDVPTSYSDEEKRKIRLMLILDKIAKNASIDIPEDDVNMRLLELLQHEFIEQFGKPPKEKELISHFKNIFSPRIKERYKKRFRLERLREKIIPYIKKNVTLNKKFVSSEEVKELVI